jgi:ATP-dependent Clp protease ATP-binding subunit ClpB
VEDTIDPARLKEKYELHHGVRITDRRWWRPRPVEPLHHRPLPARQGDRPDRRGRSRLRMQVDSKPEELDELDRRIMQLKIEREALKKETDRRPRTGSRSWRRSWPT